MQRPPRRRKLIVTHNVIVYRRPSGHQNRGRGRLGKSRTGRRRLGEACRETVPCLADGRPVIPTVRTPPWGLRFPASSGAGFHVVFQGACWLLRGDGSPPLALHAGDVLFVSHRQEIALADPPASPLTDVTREMDNAWTGADRAATSATVLICGSYQLDGTSPHPLLAELPGIVHLPKRIGRHAPLSVVVDLLGDELDRRRAGADAIVSGLLDTMLLYILRSWYEEQAAESTSGWAAALADPAVSAALLRIHQAPAHPWTVAELGTQAGLSRAAFARRFTTLVGQPPLAYLTWWRMNSAGALLRGSDASQHAIAERAGYASESAFNRACKRQYGSTPGDYRRQHTAARLVGPVPRRGLAVAVAGPALVVSVLGGPLLGGLVRRGTGRRRGPVVAAVAGVPSRSRRPAR
ncbi:MAG TPA: AraC family transcriptional regulator, partial [Trebonia sp.]